MFEDFSFCTECEHYDREKRCCKLFKRTMVCGCQYGGALSWINKPVMAIGQKRGAGERYFRSLIAKLKEAKDDVKKE